MKILFIIRSSTYFHYYKSTIESLCNRGHFVTALFDPRWSPSAEQKAVTDFDKRFKNFNYSWARPRSGFGGALSRYARDMASYHRFIYYPKLEALEPFFKDWKAHMPFALRAFLKIPGAKQLVKLRLTGDLLLAIDDLVPADKKSSGHIADLNPDIVVASPVNMRGLSADAEYLKAAKRLRIPTAVQVISWDNLTVRGRLYFKPDRLLVWNDFQANEAESYHGIDNAIIRKTGAPVFDNWFMNLKSSLSRKDFCARYGLREEHPYFLYLGSARNIAHNESAELSALARALKDAGPPLDKVQIVFRPHGANYKQYENLNLNNVTMIKGTLPDTKEALQLFYDTLYHAVLAVNINTSGIIDAVIAGKPGVALIYEKYRKSQTDTLHFKQLQDFGAIELVNSPSDFAAILAEILRGKDRLKVKREEFIKKFVRPCGLNVPAGERAAKEIEKLAYA